MLVDVLLRRCEQQTSKGQAQLVYLPEATLFPRPGVEWLGQTDRLVKFIAACLLFVGRDRNLFWSIDENNFHWARLDMRQTEIDPNTTETGLNVGLAGFRE